jgi:hypothetical protein
MNSRLRRIAARVGGPLLRPVRAQAYAWIEYRIGLAEARLAGQGPLRMRACDAEGGEREVTFEDVVPALLNAISSANAVAREGRRREVALGERIDALEAELRFLRAASERPAREQGLRAA